jgi:hypothetical protein
MEDGEFNSFFAESESLDDKPLIEAIKDSAPVRMNRKPRRTRFTYKLARPRRVRRSPDRQWAMPIQANAPPGR